jgi:hypothetical protein
MSPSCSRLRLFIARDSLVDGELLIVEIRGFVVGQGIMGRGVSQRFLVIVAAISFSHYILWFVLSL